METSTDLNELTFLRVLYRLQELGFRSTATKRNFGPYRPGMATGAQVALVRRLWRTYCPDDPKETALNAWLAKYHKVSALRFVSAEAAGHIIPGLRAMAERKAAAGGP